MATHPTEDCPRNVGTARDAAISAGRLIMDHLRDSRPIWTYKEPTIQGYYWCRGPKHDHEPIVVRVLLDYSGKDVPIVVQSGHPDNAGVAYLKDYHGCEWCGPLEMPHSR